mgnify:CR=1 FL=1
MENKDKEKKLQSMVHVLGKLVRGEIHESQITETTFEELVKDLDNNLQWEHVHKDNLASTKHVIQETEELVKTLPPPPEKMPNGNTNTNPPEGL